MAMFADTKKKKSKVQIDLGGAFAGFMAGMGAPGGAQQLAAHHQRRQSMADAEREAQQYEQRRRDGLTDHEAKQKIDQRYAPAPNNDTVNDYKFIEQQLGPDAAKQYLRSLGDPTVTTVLPGNRVYSGPRSQLGSALGAPAPGPQPGQVEDGFRFKGGNPGDPSAWEPVGQQGGPQGSPLSGGFLGRR